MKTTHEKSQALRPEKTCITAAQQPACAAGRDSEALASEEATPEGGPTEPVSVAKPVSEATTPEPLPGCPEPETRTPQSETASESIEATPATGAQPSPQVELLDLNRIVTGSYNPRKDFREDTLLELSESIRQSGVLQPICVRPHEDGFEIVYGERRYWAAAMAGLTHIPALVRALTDAEAVDAAITENLQREDVKPREEAAAYKLALESGRHTVESLVGKFGKSEAYIRSRLKLCDLIDALAEQLDREDISVGVAVEIAKYPAEIQEQVYAEHFDDGCRVSWRNARIREIARRLYDQYMTKLENYRFDKSDCTTCSHNTANQVLFRDECEGGCAGCQMRECMVRKNNEYLVQQALKLLKEDPRTILATAGDTPAAVLEVLESEGYHVEELEYSIYCYDLAPRRPEEPQAAAYASEEAFSAARQRYEALLDEFTERTQKLEFDISEGRTLKYAILGALDVQVRYDDVPEQQETVDVESPDGSKRQVLVTIVPPSPLETLERQDQRNRQICYEHITSKMKEVLRDAKVSNKPLQKEERQMLYYAIMRGVNGGPRLQQCGFRSKEKGHFTVEEQFAAAGRITSKQQAALVRTFLANFFRVAAPESYCTDRTLDTQLLCRFGELNFAEQSRQVQQEFLAVYEKRRVRIQEQIDDLKAQAEAAQRVASLCEEPDFEPDFELEELPDMEPPQPERPHAEPLLWPVDPEIVPVTHAPDEALRMAA